MILLAGPNGAGKSTFHETRVAPRFSGPFITANILQRDVLGDMSPAASYTAAALAATRRAELLAQGLDFVTETVFSHASKLDLIDDARAKGFTIIVLHIGVNSPEISVARVSARIGEGGHAVPEEKIRARYARGGDLIRKAILGADRGMVYDNSRLNEAPTQCLVFAKGRLVFALPILPAWIREIYAADLVR